MKTLNIDIVGSSLIMFAVVILIYGSTFPSTMNLSVLSMTLLLTGLVGSLFFKTVKVSWAFDMKTIFYGIVTGIVIIISNITFANIKLYSQVAPFNLSLFMILIAVAEELVIRGMLMPFLEDLSGNMWFGIFGSALTWALYHYYVSNQNMMFLTSIFIAGLILGYVDRKMGSLTPSILAHVLNNLMVVI